MTIVDIKKNTEQKMLKSIDALKSDLAKVRTGRAHTGLLDHVMVDYYGTMMPINQVANINLLDARTISVQPWEKKLAQAVEKAIRDSDLGLNPQSQGDVIRVPMPALTEERRRDLVKVIKHEAEGAKVAVRNLRRDANQQLKDLVKAKVASEDDERRSQDDIQKMTDRFIVEVDKLLAQKEAEILAV
ncbi:MAG: ribosome recycling factor [Burkholderiales bacterium]|jgi:ribosome recycling factor|nr:ribosome recycling factor [Burkholderiales bacterium]